MKPFRVIRAELIEHLRAYRGPRYHAVLSDPPYALISIAKRFGGEDAAQATEGSDGRFRRLSTGFMGQQWDGFDTLDDYRAWVAEWSGLMIEHALYPGAVGIFFGGTRTWHHLALGLDQGGFEIYDTLMWLYGQGFPKSHNISKFIDNALGAERTEVIGVKPGHEEFAGRESDGDTRFGEGATNGFGRPWMNDEEARERYHMQMAPATDEAERWEGWGTALKPAWEPILLVRAPRGGERYADLALEHGTGALNIDGSRVEGPKGYGVWGTSNETTDPNRMFNSLPDKAEYRTKPHPSGRWPSNVLLSHHPDCVKVGEEHIEGRTLNRYPSKGSGGSFAFYAQSHKGEDYQSESTGPDTIERWACVPECPIRTMEESGAPEHAARFFYCTKAGNSERDHGVEDFHWKRTADGYARITAAEFAKLPENQRHRGNIHPTVKPLDLCRYLAGMILPPELDGPRRIFIPFAGSGSEMIAARQAEWDEVVGVEMDTNFADIAEARLAKVIGWF